MPSSSLPGLVGPTPLQRASASSLRRGRSSKRDCALHDLSRRRLHASRRLGDGFLPAASSCPNLRSVMRHPVVSPLILRIEIIRLTVGSGKKRPPVAESVTLLRLAAAEGSDHAHNDAASGHLLTRLLSQTYPRSTVLLMVGLTTAPSELTSPLADAPRGISIRASRRPLRSV